MIVVVIIMPVFALFFASIFLIFIIELFSTAIVAKGSPYSFGFVFVSASMALYAILVVGDPLFSMLFVEFGLAVFVTACAGVIFVAFFDMAVLAFVGVVSVETKILGVFKSGRCPFFCRVTIFTGAAQIPVHSVQRSFMA